MREGILLDDVRTRETPTRLSLGGGSVSLVRGSLLLNRERPDWGGPCLSLSDASLGLAREHVSLKAEPARRGCAPLSRSATTNSSKSFERSDVAQRSSSTLSSRVSLG